ncbi:hypothetical protein Tco_1067178 [Tanacetum coccineum]|uniref:CCHC-type domain-containing protein n=1 Tax=Tanacetum coccineum TaxID=301880 RepID=A0ABQ5HC59_9ASTR
MTTPHPTPFPATTPSARVLAPFVIIFDSDDEITTLLVRLAPLSPDRTLALYGYPLDSSDDSSDEDMSKTAESLHTQTASISVKDKVAKNASNKRKWEGDHGGSSSQNKGHKVIRAHTAEPSNKKGYAGNIPRCNKCKFHHTGPCAAKCGTCKWVGHQTRDCRTLVPRAKQRPSVAK